MHLCCGFAWPSVACTYPAGSEDRGLVPADWVPVVDVGLTPESNFEALFGFNFPGFNLLGSQSFADATSTAAGSATLGVTVSLAPGQTVWVDVLLQTPAVNGSRVDASGTLVTGWDDSLNLTPATVVPEPGTSSLIGLGLAGMVLSQRKYRKLSLFVDRGTRTLPI